MPNGIFSEQVNLQEPPKKIHTSENEEGEITLGDLHANTIKLIFMLAIHGIATNISKKDYQKLYEIYTTPVKKLKKEHLEEFNSILDNQEFSHHLKVRLLGDEFADRGENDYFTLSVLQALHNAKVPYEILLSNHGLEFIAAYEILAEFESCISEDQSRSRHNLLRLIDNDLLIRDEIIEIINKVYKPALKAVSYSLSEDKKEITIYSHAPMGFDLIKKLAKKFNVDYKDKTTTALAQTIDRINEKFQQYVQTNTVHTLYKSNDLYDAHRGKGDKPIALITWSRNHGVFRPPRHNDFALNFVHGHDTDTFDIWPKEEHIYNLDNCLGKSSNDEGTYTVFYSPKQVIKPSLLESNNAWFLSKLLIEEIYNNSARVLSQITGFGSYFSGHKEKAQNEQIRSFTAGTSSSP